MTFITTLQYFIGNAACALFSAQVTITVCGCIVMCSLTCINLMAWSVGLRISMTESMRSINCHGNWQEICNDDNSHSTQQSRSKVCVWIYQPSLLSQLGEGTAGYNFKAVLQSANILGLVKKIRFVVLFRYGGYSQFTFMWVQRRRQRYSQWGSDRPFHIPHTT